MMNLSSEEKSLPQKISEDIIELILEERICSQEINYLMKPFCLSV